METLSTSTAFGGTQGVYRHASTATGTDSTSVAAKVTRIAQRAEPPVFQMERTSRVLIALMPAWIISAARTAIGTCPTRLGKSSTMASINTPPKMPAQRVRAPTLTLSAV